MKKNSLFSVIAITVMCSASDLRAQWEPQTAGSTYYEYQSNGSIGQRIALDDHGGVHVIWMKGLAHGEQRGVYYNYRDWNGQWLVPGEGQPVSWTAGAGFCQLDLYDEGRAFVIYHRQFPDPNIVMAADSIPGYGIFHYRYPPSMLEFPCYWPYFSIDANDKIHVILSQNPPVGGDPFVVGYTRSSDLGETWTELIPVDTLTTISTIIVSSRVSSKTAIVYCHPTDIESPLKNDVHYVESADGIDWDWEDGKINVTEYGEGGESLFAYTDLDAIYDYNDDLHIIWNAQWYSGEAYLPTTFLYHFDSDAGIISEVNRSDSIWDNGCEIGERNRPICKMSMGVQEESGALFAVYTAFNSEDCSAGGYSNGDIYMQYSLDNGMSWAPPINVTDSPGPGCQPGNCDSDHWASVADRVDDRLHVTYIDDKDAGSSVHQEGQWTENPVLYQEIEIATLGIEKTGREPERFILAQNYPNPFNNRTMIEFELQTAAQVKIAVFDITGRLVDVLYDASMDAGRQSIFWKAEDVASGTYFYKLTTPDGSRVRRMTLLK